MYWGFHVGGATIRFLLRRQTPTWIRHGRTPGHFGTTTDRDSDRCHRCLGWRPGADQAPAVTHTDRYGHGLYRHPAPGPTPRIAAYRIAGAFLRSASGHDRKPNAGASRPRAYSAE